MEDEIKRIQENQKKLEELDRQIAARKLEVNEIRRLSHGGGFAVFLQVIGGIGMVVTGIGSLFIFTSQTTGGVFICAFFACAGIIGYGTECDRNAQRWRLLMDRLEKLYLKE